MTLQRFLRILLARRWLALTTCGTLVVLAVIASFVVSKTYVAETSIIIDTRSQDVASGSGPDQFAFADYLQTQVEIIDSHNVAVKAVDTLKLADRSDLKNKFQLATHGAGRIQDWLADDLLRNLIVTPSRAGGVISIKYRSQSANDAAAVANAVAQGYLATNLQLTVDPARQRASWFDEQVQTLREQLETGQRRLAAYQNAQGVDGASGHLDVETSRLGEISDQLVNAQATLADAQARRSQLDSARESQHLDQLPDVVNDTVSQGLRSDLSRAENQLNRIRLLKGPSHPDYQSALAEVLSLRRRVADQMARTSGSIEQGAQLAAQRVKEVQAELDAQKARVLQLREQQDQYDVLSRDVQSAEHAYDAALQRTAELKLQGQSTSASAAILNTALPPLWPDRPRLLQNLLVAMLLGPLFGILAAILSESSDRRLRTQEDFASLVGIRLLGEVPRLPVASTAREVVTT
jgi:succinoglycan biosynthesis transport protein ExoP